MPEFLKSLTPTAKWMILLVLILLIGIAVRWKYVSREVEEAFRSRFSIEKVENDGGNF